MFRLSSLLVTAQLQGTLDAANTGAGRSVIRLYSTPRPAALGAHSDAPQAEIVLAKPCGAVSGGVLVLLPDQPALVLSGGQPRWAEWYTASGSLLLDGAVTDNAHAGDIRVEGGATPEGDDSPQLYIGGLVYLGLTALT